MGPAFGGQLSEADSQNSADSEATWRAGLRPGIGLALGVVLSGLLLALTVLWARDRQVERSAHPLVEGRILVEGFSDSVEVRRDGVGIPHIRASNSLDAWAAVGFVQAQDRLGQMLWLRQVARGRTAEWVGPSGVRGDRFARTVGFARIADAMLPELPESTRRVLEHFAQGVSARIERVRRGSVGLPPSLAAFGLDPAALEPWSAVDSVAVFKVLAWGAGPSIDAPVVLDQLTQRLGGVGARPFEPQGEGHQTISVAFTPPGAEFGSSAAVRRKDMEPPADAAVPHLYSGTAWVLSGRHTASGLPVLAADWQLAPTAPALLHQVNVDAPGLRFAGALVPGLPIVWLGRSEAMAWALLPARAITTGFFEETLRSTKPVPLYHDGFAWKPVEQREEAIRVRDAGGGLREERWLVQETRHGPLVQDLFADDDSHPEVTGSAPLALAWTGAVAGDGLTALVEAPLAGSSDVFRESLREHHDPVIAAVFADGKGGGAQVAGWLPRRLLPTSMQPVPGRLRTYDWSIRIPFEELPAQSLGKGAERDWVAISDGRVDSDRPSTAADAEWLWRTATRAARLDRLLGRFAARGRVDLRDVAEIQSDSVSGEGPAFVRSIVSLVEEDSRLPPEEAEIVEILRNWDGGLQASSRGAAAYSVVVAELTESLFADAMTSELFRRYQALPQTRLDGVMRGVVLAATRGGAAGWSAPERVRPLVHEALRRTWARLTFELGPNRDRWTWGRLQRSIFRSFVPGGGGDFELGAPLGGGQDTLLGAGHDSRFAVLRASTYRMAVDLAVADEMLSTLAPGQSEHASHPHARDGMPAWEKGPPQVLRTAPGLIVGAQDRLLVLEPAP